MYPKLSFGLYSFDTNCGYVYLKEKNSNYEYKISYSDGKKPSGGGSNNYFTLTPSVSFGYKLFHRLYLNADIMLSYFKTDIVFEKEFTNLYTNKKTVEYFDYKKDIYTLSFGAGIIYVMGFRKKNG